MPGALSESASVGRVPVEQEIARLRSMVEEVLPESLRLEGIDVVVGSLLEGQSPNFKAIVRVRQKYEDLMGTAGWVYELTERVRAVWGQDELYVEVIEKAAEDDAENAV